MVSHNFLISDERSVTPFLLVRNGHTFQSVTPFLLVKSVTPFLLVESVTPFLLVRNGQSHFSY